jgi:predicted MFS family arabinose efflux permease
VAAIFAANGFLMGAWAPQIPPLMPRHGITESTLGLVILSLGIGAVGAMLFAGRLIARFGGKTVLRAFALLMVPTLPAVVFAPNLPSLFIAAALFGAIAGCTDVAMNAQAVTVERALGRAIMSASHGFWSLGGFIGGGLGAFVLAHWGGTVQAWAAAAVVLAILMLALPHLLDDVPHPTEEAQHNHFLPRDPLLWLLGLLALFSMVPEGAVMDWAAVYLAKELGADTFRAGLGFAAFAGAMAIMRFSGDAIRNRFGAVKTLRVSGLIGAAGLLGGAMAPTDWVAMASFAIAGFGVANMVPVMFSAAGNHPGLPPGQAISTVTMVGYAGILIAPATIGYVAEHIGFRATYATLALLLIVVAALAGLARAADGVKSVTPPEPK